MSNETITNRQYAKEIFFVKLAENFNKKFPAMKTDATKRQASKFRMGKGNLYKFQNTKSA